MTGILSDQIADEALIVWVEDVSHMPYVRQFLATTVPSRTRRPSRSHHPGQLVGYATLRASARSGACRWMFSRRIFWLREDDRECHRLGAGCWPHVPCEAVDPRSVRPRVPGRLPGDPDTQGETSAPRELDEAGLVKTEWEIGEATKAGVEVTKTTRYAEAFQQGRILRRRRFIVRDNCISEVHADRCGGTHVEFISNFRLAFNRNEVVGVVDGQHVPEVSGCVHINHRGRHLDLPFKMSLADFYNNRRFIRRLGSAAAPHLDFCNRHAGIVKAISLHLSDFDL